jgi:hypothetical protein
MEAIVFMVCYNRVKYIQHSKWLKHNFMWVNARNTATTVTHDHYILTHKRSNNISVNLSKGSEFYSVTSDTCNTATTVSRADKSLKNISNGLKMKNMLLHP